MTEKSLPVVDRFLLRQFKKNVNGKFDIGIVEILKNSDDSLKRIERGRSLTEDEKLIRIYYKTGRRNPYIIIVDNAEGMTRDKLSEIIRYGGAVSGREKTDIVSGLFGIGLKDAIYGIGAGLYSKITDRINCGEIITLKEENWHKVEFFVTNENGIEKAKYKIHQKYEPTTEDLELLSTGHGTLIKIYPHHVQIPYKNTLKRSLVSYIRLRDILSTDERKVQLIHINQKNIDHLRWTQTWESEELLYNDTFQLDEYPGEDITLTLHRANRTLTYSDAMHGEKGLLIRSKGDIHELTLFDFTNSNAAKSFYGDLYTELIDKLIKQREEVLEQSRTGLNRSHPFYIALRNKVNKILKKLVELEEERKREESNISKKTERTLKSLALLLKQIAVDELTEEEALVGPNPITKRTRIPDFGFIGRSRRIYLNIESTINFYARIPEEIDIGDVIELNIDNDLIELDCSGFTIEEDLIDNNMIKYPIRVKGIQANIEGTLIAKCGEKERSLVIKVIEKPKLKNFGFSKEQYNIPISSKRNVTFSAFIDEQVEVGNPIIFTSNKTFIEIHPSNTEIGNNQDGYFVATLTILVLEEAEESCVIKAECGGKTAKAVVNIIVDPPKTDFPEPKLDDQTLNPIYPVLFNRFENKFIIYTKDRTVKPFWDPTVQDQIRDNERFKIRFGDLIVEATIDYLIDRKLGNVASSSTEAFQTSREARKYDIYRNVAYKIYNHLGL